MVRVGREGRGGGASDGEPGHAHPPGGRRVGVTHHLGPQQAGGGGAEVEDSMGVWLGLTAGPPGQLSVTPRPHGLARGVVEVAVN